MSADPQQTITGRIGLVGCDTTYPPTESPAVHVYQVWHRMQRMGYEIHAWGPKAVPGCTEYPRTEEGFAELIKNVDLLYVRFPFEYFFTVRCIARLLTSRRLPVVCEFNAPLYQFTRDVPWISRWGLKHRARIYGRNHLLVRSCVDHAICTCAELADYARDHFGLRDVSVVPDGADPEQFHPGLRAEGRAAMGVGDDDFVVFWGGITKYRWQAFDRIIATAAGFDNRDVRFVLAGDRAHLPERLPPNIVTMGHVPYADMPRLMAGSDACLCVYESYDWCPIGFWHSPLKLFEYMACARPVIASNMGQIARVIRHGENGYLTDASPDDIADKIRSLLSDRARAEAVGRAARDTVLQGYTWQGVAERTDEIVSALIRESRAPAPRGRAGARKTAAADGRNGELRLGFFSAHGGYGGTEEYLNKLVRAASQNGYRVSFFHPAESPQHWVEQLSGVAQPVPYDPLPQTDGGGVQQAAAAGRGLREVARSLYRRWVPHSVRFLVGFLRDVHRMRRVFARWPVDVLHFSDLGADPPILAARLAGIRRLTGALNCLPRDDPFRWTGTYRLLEALCLLCMDDIAAVSGKGRELWLRHIHMDPRKVRVIHNSTEIPPLNGVAEMSRQVRSELGIRLAAKVVGVSAALVPIKGHGYLLDAFADVVCAVPDALLVLAGDGPLRDHLAGLAGRLGISESVKFLGHRKDIRRIVQAYDVIALTSVTESLPFSLLEGMSYGKPAVATAVGGVPELVEDGVNGYVVPPRDPRATAAALLQLLGSPEKLLRMGRAARESVEARFAAETMIRDTMNMVLGAPPRKGTVAPR